MMQAERDFSIKKTLESPHKKLAGPDYFRSVMFLSCNKKHLLPLVTGGAIEPRTAHFVDLLKRAKVSGRGLSRTAARCTRKRRRDVDRDSDGGSDGSDADDTGTSEHDTDQDLDGDEDYGDENGSETGGGEGGSDSGGSL